MKKKFILFLILLNICLPVYAKEISLVKCVDGDTADFKIGSNVEKVRFLAIDTPETKHPTKGEQPFGKEASEYTCNSLKEAGKIEIEYDDNARGKDKYGRSLGWIFVDGSLLQKQLVSKGLAKVAYLYDDYKYTSELEEEEKLAREAKIGVWSDAGKNSSFLDKSDYDNSSKYSPYVVIFIVIVILLCIFSKKFRRKTYGKVKRKVSRKINREIDSEIDKLFK